MSIVRVASTPANDAAVVDQMRFDFTTGRNDFGNSVESLWPT